MRDLYIVTNVKSWLGALFRRLKLNVVSGGIVMLGLCLITVTHLTHSPEAFAGAKGASVIDVVSRSRQLDYYSDDGLYLGTFENVLQSEVGGLKILDESARGTAKIQIRNQTVWVRFSSLIVENAPLIRICPKAEYSSVDRGELVTSGAGQKCKTP